MKRTTKRIITISSVLVAILMLLCAGVILYINSIFDRIEKIPEVSRVDPSNEFFETDSPEESPTTAPVVKPEDIDWGEIEPFLDDKLQYSPGRSGPLCWDSPTAFGYNASLQHKPQNEEGVNDFISPRFVCADSGRLF